MNKKIQKKHIFICDSISRSPPVPSSVRPSVRTQVVFSNVWQLLVTFDNFWQLLATFGILTSGNFRQVMANYDKFWQILANFDNFWQLLATIDNFWQLLATFSNFWQLLATFGIFWQLLAAKANFWQFLATFGIFWQLSLLATFGNYGNIWQLLDGSAGRISSLYLKPWPVRIFEDITFSLYIVAASESDEGLVSNGPNKNLLFFIGWTNHAVS